MEAWAPRPRVASCRGVGEIETFEHRRTAKFPGEIGTGKTIGSARRINGVDRQPGSIEHAVARYSAAALRTKGNDDLTSRLKHAGITRTAECLRRILGSLICVVHGWKTLKWLSPVSSGEGCGFPIAICFNMTSPGQSQVPFVATQATNCESCRQLLDDKSRLARCGYCFEKKSRGEHF
jgi:hypothetical protein